MHALIAGGGIGGLTTALCLHQAGIRATVFESAPEIKALGVGINLLPHAIKELDRLGLLDRLLDEGVELQRFVWLNRHGQQIWSEPRGRSAGYNWPQVSIHRGTLHSILFDAVRERLGEGAVVTGHHVVDVEQDRRGVSVDCADRQTGGKAGVYRGDMLIGADGIHSAIRKKYYPDEGPPLWNGNMLWRMTVETEPVMGGQVMIAMGHSALKIVGYEISGEAKSRGRSLFNWIADVRTGRPGTALPEREDWNRRGDPAEFVPYFRDWVFDWLDVPALAGKSGPVRVFPMVDRDPVERWTFGRVTLLGDAAHPMWPVGANGASQAVLDARCLSDRLAQARRVPEALLAYERIRLPETAEVVRANRRKAHDRILDIAEERAPEGFNNINEFTSAGEIEGILADYRKTARFSREQLQPE